MRPAIKSSTIDALHGARASELLHFPKTSGADRGGISSGYSTAFLLLLITVPVWGQSVAITSPADGATIQAVNLTNGRELSITSTVTEGSGYRTYRVCATANGKLITPEPCSYRAPWTVKAYPGYWGDGAVDYVVTTYDIFGAVLATSAKHTATTRLTGLTASFTVSGTSGTVTVTSTDWHAGLTPMSSGCPGQLYIDGFHANASPYYTNIGCFTAGTQFGLDTTRFFNGKHEIHMDYTSQAFGGLSNDPVVFSASFTSGNISGATITLPAANNLFVTNRPSFFTGVGGAGTNGGIWTSYASMSSPNTIVSDICNSGSCVATLSSNPGSPTTVDVEDVWLNNIDQANCEGLFAVTGSTSSTVTYAAPNCPNGTMNIGGQGANGTLAIVTNPVYAIWLTATTVQVAATPNGSGISGITCAGTCTVNAKLTNGYWKFNTANSEWNTTPSSFARQVVDFENGHTAMEYRPASSEINGVVGTSGPTLCGTVAYTDGLSPTAVDCSMVTYLPVDDGGVTGAVTVNATTGVPTFVKAAWAKVTSTYSTFPAVTTYVHNCPTACTPPTFTHDGHVATSYTPGQSFVPTSWWNLDLCLITPACTTGSDNYPLYLAPLMRDSGINTTFSGANIPGPNLANPASTSCGSIPAARETQLDAILNQWNFYQELYIGDFNIPAVPIGSFINNSGFDRQTCAKNAIANRKATGRITRLVGEDEITTNIGMVLPNCTGVVGTPCFTNITTAGGVATFHGAMWITEAIWNQANGTGAAVLVKGATNTCANGWYYVTGKIVDGVTGLISAFTAATSCAGTNTYDGTTDPGMKFQYLGVNAINTVGAAYWIHACVLPKAIGNNNNNYAYQGWTTIETYAGGPALADTTLTSIVGNGSLVTVVDTGHGFTDGQSIAVQGATTTALNGLHVIHVVDANTFTFPSSLAGTYTVGTDPNLLISSDCNLPTDYYAQLHGIFHQGGDIAVLNTITGDTYVPAWIKSWYDPAVSDTIMVYHPQGCNGIYGNDCPVYASQLANQNYTLNTRAYQPALRANLNSVTMVYEKQHLGYLFDPAKDNPITQYLDRPETQVGGMMSDVTFGIVSERIYTFRGRNSTEYLAPIGSASGSGTGPEYNKQWAAISRSFQAMQHLDRYILQPHTTSPYFGLMYNTLQTTSTYGNMLMAVCLLDGGTTETRTVDLTGIRQAGGSIYRMSLSGYRLRFDALADNPTSDTYTNCGAGAGETVTYIAQPSGAVSDLVPTTFTPPITLPYGATKYGIRIGYYPREMNDDPVTDCTSGCTINLMRTGGPVWYQNIYANNSWTPLATGDPTMLAGQ